MQTRNINEVFIDEDHFVSPKKLKCIEGGPSCDECEYKSTSMCHEIPCQKEENVDGLDRIFIITNEVEVIRNVKPGYLVHYVLSDDDQDYVDDEIHYFDKLFDNPPLIKYHEEINTLNKEIIKLEEQSQTLSKRNSDIERIRRGMKEIPFLNSLVKFINDDFKYILYLRDYRIIGKDHVFLNKHFYIANTNEYNYFLILDNGRYTDSSHDYAIMVFDTFEDAQKEAKERFMKELITKTSPSLTYPASSNDIKQFFRSIDSSSKISSDPELLALYNTKYKEAEKREIDKHTEALNEKIQKASDELQRLKKIADEPDTQKI
jgi:hypothetical protein